IPPAIKNQYKQNPAQVCDYRRNLDPGWLRQVFPLRWWNPRDRQPIDHLIPLSREDGDSVPTQSLPDEIRPRGSPDVPFQLSPLQLLQMCRLRQQEQLVQGSQLNVLDSPQMQAHAQMTQQEQGFLAGD